MDRSVLSSRLATIGIAVGIVVLALGVSEILGRTMAQLLNSLPVNLPTIPRLVLSVVLQQGLVFGGLSVIYLWIRNRDLGWIGVSLPDFKQFLWIAGGWAVAFASAFVFGIIIILLGLNPGKNQLVRVVSETPEALLVMIPVTILLIGPGEELLFRGIIQGSLRERFGPIVAIVLASVIFAAAHVTSLTGGLESRIITVALLIVPALVFAIAYERTGNLVVPALIHGLYNATLFSLQYAAIKLGGAPAILLL